MEPAHGLQEAAPLSAPPQRQHPEQHHLQQQQQANAGPPPGVAALPPAPPHQQQQAPPEASPVQVLHGTCGWSDASLVRCGRFYPRGVRSTEDKLKFYSRRFGCVEVDTSTFAIPRPDVTARWAAAAAPGFLFHVKAFGLFCAQSCQVSCLPAEARVLLAPALAAAPQGYARLGASCPPAAEDACWRCFHAALEPLYQAGKLGAVVFQFHLSFTPSQANLEYVLRCRRRLDPRFRMAAELRCRGWLADPAWRARLVEALAAQGVTIVSADELEHETAQKDREQRGLPPGAVRRVLPIALEVTTPGWHYVRVHRRHGTTDRLLPAGEAEAWAARIERQLAPRLAGPVYFLWGTDWEDVPIRNSRSLDAALPLALRCDWQARFRGEAPPKGSIHALFAAASSKGGGGTQGAAAAGSTSSLPSGGSAGLPAAPADEETLGQQQQQQQASQPAAGSGRKREREEGERGSQAAARKSGGGGILRFLQRPAV